MKKKTNLLDKEISTTAFVLGLVVFLFLSAMGYGGYYLGLKEGEQQQAFEDSYGKKFVSKKVLGQTSELDQAAYNSDPNFYEAWGYNGYLREQSFIPTLDRLTKVNLMLSGVNFNGNTPLRLSVLNASRDSIVNEKTLYPTITERTGLDFVFATPTTVIPGSTYFLRLQVMNETDGSWLYWYTCGNTYTNGSGYEDGTASPFDFAFMTYGYNYSEPVDETQTVTLPTTTKTTAVTPATTATAPVVAPSVLAVPMNFRVDRNQDEQIVFSWDLNKEADLAGYVLYVYEAKKEVETEIIDITDKELDNYNLALADHPKLSKDKEYDVKLAAKNTAGAVSEKTLSLRVKFQPKVNVVVEEAQKTFLENPYVMGGLGALLVALVALLVFMERKFHGLARLFKKKE